MTETVIGPHKLLEPLPANPEKWNAKRPLVAFGKKRVQKVEYSGWTYKQFSDAGIPWDERHEEVDAMLEWDGYTKYWTRDADKVVWVDFGPTELTLRLCDWERGRSAVTYWWEDEKTHIMYPMFGKDMYEIVRSSPKIEMGVITAKFKAVKRGANYGIALVP